MDLNQLVNELIEVSRSGTRVPGFRGKTMIDADRLGVLLSELQNNMPSGVQEAQTIITQKDSIISQAQMEASRIVDEARNSAAQISTAASAEQQEKYLIQRSFELLVIEGKKLWLLLREKLKNLLQAPRVKCKLSYKMLSEEHML